MAQNTTPLCTNTKSQLLAINGVNILTVCPFCRRLGADVEIGFHPPEPNQGSTFIVDSLPLLTYDKL